MLAEFVAAYPAVDLSLRTGTTHELIEQTVEHRLDGAFVCGPVKHPGLRVEPFFREELVVLTATNVADFDAFAQQGDLRIIVLRRAAPIVSISKPCGRGAASSACGISSSARSKPSSAASGRARRYLAARGPDRAGLAAGSACGPSSAGGEGSVETVFIRHRDAYGRARSGAFLDIARPVLARPGGGI